MFCEKCGAKVEDNSRFCPQCGAPLTPAAPVGPGPAGYGYGGAQPNYGAPQNMGADPTGQGPAGYGYGGTQSNYGAPQNMGAGPTGQGPTGYGYGGTQSGGLRVAMFIISIISAISALFVYLYGHNAFFREHGFNYASSPEWRFWNHGGGGPIIFAGLLVLAAVTFIVGLCLRKK